MSYPDAKEAPFAPGSGSLGGGLSKRDREEVDPELVQLPDPPRRERTWTLCLLAVTAVASLLMVAMLARDAVYAFSSPAAIEAGDLFTLEPTAVGSARDDGQNRLVAAHGMLGASGGIRYERPFESDSYRLVPVAGRTDLWVEVQVPAGEESSRYVPPMAFYGRLVRFDAVGPRHRGLRDRVPEGAWLLVGGETPGRARSSVALVALFLGFAIWNVLTFFRLLRRVR